MLSSVDERRYAGLPRFIFGVNGRGGEAPMLAAHKPGWVVLKASVNPPNSSGDFAALASEGLGVIVQLEYGSPARSIPPCPDEYERFARKCAEFVAQSRGARLWAIGDEPNVAPGPAAPPDAEREVITPELYARCFIRCREAIRSLPGHEQDWVIPAATAPFNYETKYPSNPTGDWVRYFADVLLQITMQGSRADALALHALTRGIDPEQVTSEERAEEPFSNRRRHFRAYRDFLAAVIPAMRTLPVLITAARPGELGWTDGTQNWIQAACAEIDAWNSDPANQPIQALCFDRWEARPGDGPERGMSDQQVVADLGAALQNPYRVRWPLAAAQVDGAGEADARLLAGEARLPDFAGHELYAGDRLHVRVSVENCGAQGWPAEGIRRVLLGYRWHSLGGEEMTLRRYHGPFPMVGPALPGEFAAFDAVE
ncbi:MAG: hypothetical protein ACM3JD_04570, partial [Rudaea sp.]